MGCIAIHPDPALVSRPRSASPEREKLSAHLAQVGATERRNCRLLTAFGQFTEACDSGQPNCVGGAVICAGEPSRTDSGHALLCRERALRAALRWPGASCYRLDGAATAVECRERLGGLLGYYYRNAA
jgi:hypothetical protein